MPARKHYADDEIADPWLPWGDAAPRMATRSGQAVKAEVSAFDPNHPPAAFPSLDWLSSSLDAAMQSNSQPSDLERPFQDLEVVDEQPHNPTANNPRFVTLNSAKIFSGATYSVDTIVDWRYSNGQQNQMYRANMERIEKNGAPPSDVQETMADGRLEGRDLSNFELEMATSEEENTPIEQEDGQVSNWAQISPALQARMCENMKICYHADDGILAKMLDLTEEELSEAIFHRKQRRQQEADEYEASRRINEEHLDSIMRASTYGVNSASSPNSRDYTKQRSSLSHEISSMNQRQRIVDQHFTELRNKYSDGTDYLTCKSVDIEKAKDYLLMVKLDPELADVDFEPPEPFAQSSPQDLDRPTDGVIQNTTNNMQNRTGDSSGVPAGLSGHGIAIGQYRENNRDLNSMDNLTKSSGDLSRGESVRSKVPKTQQLQTPDGENSKTLPEGSSGSSRRKGLRDPQQRKKSRALEESEAYESETREERMRGSDASATDIHQRRRIDTNGQGSSSMSEDELTSALPDQNPPAEGIAVEDTKDKSLILPLKVKRKKEGQAVLRKPKSQELRTEAVDQMRRNMHDVSRAQTREINAESVDEIKRNMNERFKHQGAGAREWDMCSSSIPKRVKFTKSYLNVSRQVFVQDGDRNESHLVSIGAQIYPPGDGAESQNIAPRNLETTDLHSPTQQNLMHERPASESQHRALKSHSFYGKTESSKDHYREDSVRNNYQNDSSRAIKEDLPPQKALGHKTSPRRGKDGRRCHACHKQKKGCDGKRPCERCSKTGRECRSEISEDEKGPAAAPIPTDLPSDPFVDAPGENTMLPIPRSSAQQAIPDTLESKHPQEDGEANENPQQPLDPMSMPTVPADVSTTPQALTTSQLNRALSCTSPSTIRVAPHKASLPVLGTNTLSSSPVIAQNNETDEASNLAHSVQSISAGTRSIQTNSGPVIQNVQPNAPKHRISDASIEGWQPESVELANRIKAEGIPIQPPKPQPPSKRAKISRGGEIIDFGSDHPVNSHSSTEAHSSSHAAQSNNSPELLQGKVAAMARTKKPSELSKRSQDTDAILQGKIVEPPDEATEGHADDESTRKATKKAGQRRDRKKPVMNKSTDGDVVHRPLGNRTIVAQPPVKTVSATHGTNAGKNEDQKESSPAPAKVRLNENEILVPQKKRGRGRPKKDIPTIEGDKDVSTDTQTLPVKKSIGVRKAGVREGRIEID